MASTYQDDYDRLLTEACAAQVLSFVSEHIQAGEARLAGNSVHVDAAFMRRLMPRLHAHLHHRIVDVSTVAELCSRWYPMDAKKMPRKKVSSKFTSASCCILLKP